MEIPPESLASPTPKGEPCRFSLGASPGDRAGVQLAASEGQFDDLQSVAFNKTWILSHRYCQAADGIDSLEATIHDLWHVYYQGSKYLAHDSAEHDKWVLDLLRIKGRGPLFRPAPNLGIDIARTSAGVLWNDLPFFVQDMTDFWVKEFPAMDASQRLNFAFFLAKLASVRVDNDRLCRIALLLFRDTFESVRALGSSNEPTDADPQRVIHAMSIAALLPAACAWIREAGNTIILLSNLSWHDCANSIGQGGETLVESELGRRSNMGFNPWRWMYWLKRMRQIQTEAVENDETKLAEQAGDAIDIMLCQVEQGSPTIYTAFQSSSDEIRHDADLVGLSKLVGDWKM